MYSGMIPVYNRCRGYNFRLRGGEFLWLTLTVGYRYAKLVSASQYSGIAMYVHPEIIDIDETK